MILRMSGKYQYKGEVDNLKNCSRGNFVGYFLVNSSGMEVKVGV